jgi:SAM-dependent methyltransferase
VNMNWKYKALLQLAFSNVPFGEHMNYFCQRRVTKSLHTGDAKFVSIVSYAKEHIDVVQQCYDRQIRDAIFYEFGAGWNLIGPLAFYAFGVERQILVDIRNLSRSVLVNDAIKKFQQMTLDFVFLRKPKRHIDRVSQRDFRVLLKQCYGIEYRAPCDARNTGLEVGSIDCITSTNTLEHIPSQDLHAILRECHRLLKDDGLMSFRIDYQDHYAYFDRGITVYNFLQYSDKAWTLFSPALHYQNRLRHRDYLGIFQAAGFEVVKDRPERGTAADLKNIKRLPLDKRFRVYSPEELGIRSSLLVLRKRNARFA